MNGLVSTIIIVTVALIVVAAIVYLFIQKNRIIKTSVANTFPLAKDLVNIESSVNILNLAKKIEIVNRSGQSLMLSRLNPSTSLSKRRFQEITVRGSAIGANLVQGSMPALAQAQTLAQIARAAPNGLFTATAPLSELMKYKDGTLASIVTKSGKIISHSGFQEACLAVSFFNPAVVIGAGMQAMAMISGQYYMNKISKQLDTIKRGIERLIDFHHDEKIGKLFSVENRMREIISKTYVDLADIIALQTGIQDADSIRMEYATRLERSRNKNTNIKVDTLWSRLSATGGLKRLRANIEEEFDYSFNVCLLASKLIHENKKAEIAIRIKMGEIEKANELLAMFTNMQQQSFNEASSLLDSLYQPIMEKAEWLINRQWFNRQKASDELQLIKTKKTDYIDSIVNTLSENEFTSSFRRLGEDVEILYLPSQDKSKQRMFISVKE